MSANDFAERAQRPTAFQSPRCQVLAMAACSLLLVAGCDRLKLPNKPPLPEMSASAPQTAPKAPVEPPTPK